MVHITEEPGTNILYTTAVGELDHDDYDRLLPVAQKIIQREGDIRWYFEMEDFDGWTAGTAWRDLKFDVRHLGDFEKVAVVGQKEWMEWATAFMKPFAEDTVKYFTLEQQADAREWVRA
ncbi:STAS/SEC14 domain-containing protein [Lewinella sp. IMCC34183]|uniref:STAS/SEC14 domain-containing protein n=1 Tax=Lewinella sp. IMCC34183 TaxID=2248762 RepID=UPI000E24F975|nr:STAS/SEC14 domain-containing protein [Lewinella sp. IMCC34183]